MTSCREVCGEFKTCKKITAVKRFSDLTGISPSDLFQKSLDDAICKHSRVINVLKPQTSF